MIKIKSENGNLEDLKITDANGKELPKPSAIYVEMHKGQPARAVLEYEHIQLDLDKIVDAH